MKINEILTEDKTDHNKEVLVSEDQVREFATTVKRECSAYLRNKDRRTNLFRGSQESASPIVYNREIKTRPEMSSSPDVSKALHDIMIEGGFKATRMNGYFVAPNFSHASDFSHRVYVVFPVGNYSLTWHEGFTKTGPGNTWLDYDLGADRVLMLGRELTDKMDPEPEEIAQAFWDKYGKLFKHGRNVDEAASSEAEVIVYAKGIHMIRNEVYEQYKDRLIEHWYRR